LIKTIVENNENFVDKTEFSKAKYIKRKFRKFFKVFIPIKPTARALCDYYFSKNYEKIRELRIDTLSQMLTLANVRAGSKLLVVDDTCGLIVTAILERTGGIGETFCFHDGNNETLDLLKYANFPEHVLKSVTRFPWHRFTIPIDREIKSTDPEGIERANEKIKLIEESIKKLEEKSFEGYFLF
jgi:tRNA (adenine-N(1)-)-methyltransferase non-catalytic subunit